MALNDKIEFEDLRPNAQEVLGQMFIGGPKWDGYLVSKAGRDTLVDYGLAERGFGWQWLTRDGVEMAVKAGIRPGFKWFEGRWHSKATTSVG